MKKAIDNNGEEIEVPANTVVNTINGVHYLLTPDEISAQIGMQSIWDANANNRALAALRQKRNQLLSECDWTVCNDTPFNLLKLSQWETYRQELRDLPATYANNADEVIWPIKP